MKNLDKKFLQEDCKRLYKLREVFYLWDIHEIGYLSCKDLLELGILRRVLNQVKDDEWTLERNNNLFKDIDNDCDGLISLNDFIKYFNKILPIKEIKFNEEINLFINLGNYRINEKKNNKVESINIENDWEIINSFKELESNNYVLV